LSILERIYSTIPVPCCVQLAAIIQPPDQILPEMVHVAENIVLYTLRSK
jgi:hypothetical protein